MQFLSISFFVALFILKSEDHSVDRVPEHLFYLLLHVSIDWV